MKIYLASDHAGFHLKEKVKSFLERLNYTVEDLGALSFNEADDYPKIIVKAAKKVAKDKKTKGIVFGKSGTGEAIVANKIKGVRAVVGFSRENVELSREHNDCNILSLGAQFTDEHKAFLLTRAFLETEFSKEERHVRRIKQITEIEK
ncbi:MAG: ribose-5-phosphate isomerase [Candidatus Levybacteria bacterium RBG_16_35_6]|nr:MAG: ribose-5-phosphate isomerase [Candidatus Levybacteria bacterium RBG_16_35_6]